MLLIAMIDPDNTKDKNTLKDLVVVVQEHKRKWRSSEAYRNQFNGAEEIRFTWLDGLKFSAYVKSVYGLDPSSFPIYVIASPRDEIYFKSHADGQPYSFTEKSVISGIKDALVEKGQYHSTKGFLGYIILKTSRSFSWVWV